MNGKHVKADFPLIVRTEKIIYEIPVGKHDALAHAGGTGSVDDERTLIALYLPVYMRTAVNPVYHGNTAHVLNRLQCYISFDKGTFFLQNVKI